MSRGRDLTDPERAFVHNKIRTRIQVNKNIDSEFYHNLFCEDGGVYDMIAAKMPWLAGGVLTSFSKMVLVLTPPMVLSKTLWPVVLAMDSFLS